MKICTRCQESKPTSEFAKRSRSRDGLSASCKLCNAAYQKKYRESSPDLKSKKKSYTENNKDKITERDRLYREKNREAINAKRRAYRQTERAKALKRTASSRRRARLAGLPDLMPDNFMDVLIGMYGDQCMNPECQYELSKDNPLTHDHVIPVTLPGSSHSIENSQLLCGRCNSSKGNRVIIDYRAGSTVT